MCLEGPISQLGKPRPLDPAIGLSRWLLCAVDEVAELSEYRLRPR
jgi:hypothetical protein